MLKKTRLTALALALLLSLSACGTRLDKTSEFLKYKDKEKNAALEAEAQAFYDEHQLQGLSVGVLVDGCVRFFNFGTTQEGGAAISEDTRFDLGSLTEVFTGVTYGESIYRRYLSDGSALSSVFPYLSLPTWESEGTAEGITFGQLATHRSGLPEEPSNLPREDVPYAYYTEMALRRYLSTAKLKSMPGTDYQPRNMDMGLLGFGLEVARTTPFEQHVKNVVMYSIGMTRTTITFPEDDESHLASWATPHDAQGNPLPHQEYAALQGMAAFKSTCYDMMLFAWCNMNMPGTEDTFTKPQAGTWTREEQLYLPVDDEPLEDTTYGETTRKWYAQLVGSQSVMERLYCGMMIAQDEHYSDDEVTLGYGYILDELGGQRYIYQNGGDAGNGTYLGFVPEAASAVVVLSNTAVDAGALGEALLAIILG